MHKTRVRTHDLGQMRKERDDIVLYLALDLIDAFHVKAGARAFLPDGLGGGFRDDALLGESVGGVRLGLEPDAELCPRGPQRRHPRPCIAWDHGWCAPIPPGDAGEVSCRLWRHLPRERGKKAGMRVGSEKVIVGDDYAPRPPS